MSRHFSRSKCFGAQIKHTLQREPFRVQIPMFFFSARRRDTNCLAKLCHLSRLIRNRGGLCDVGELIASRRSWRTSGWQLSLYGDERQFEAVTHLSNRPIYMHKDSLLSFLLLSPASPAFLLSIASVPWIPSPSINSIITSIQASSA